MCFSFVIAFVHGKGFDHLSGVLDDGVILFSAVGMISFVLFRGVHYNFTRKTYHSFFQYYLPLLFFYLFMTPILIASFIVCAFTTDFIGSNC